MALTVGLVIFLLVYATGGPLWAQVGFGLVGYYAYYGSPEAHRR